MATPHDSRQPGLPSINEARARRAAKAHRGPPQIWLWAALVFVVFIIIYWKLAQGELESAKGTVMAKQRAIAQTLGPKILPFRDKIERWVLELAREPPPKEPYIAPGVSIAKLRKGPGVYLRMRLEQATTKESIRDAAQRSLRDGFTSCLFVRNEQASGEACSTPGDCPPGLLCNEWRVCARPSQPYNMRLAYRALRILSSDWTDDLHQSGTDLGVRAFELDLDAVTKNDIPIAIELLHQARYFTLVLDEKPRGGLPPPLEKDAGADERPETEEERLQRVAHHARVGIWDLRTEKPLVRLRAQAAGTFVPVGDQVVRTKKTIFAQQRQVNSCALALEVVDAVRKQGQEREAVSESAASPAVQSASGKSAGSSGP